VKGATVSEFSISRESHFYGTFKTWPKFSSNFVAVKIRKFNEIENSETAAPFTNSQSITHGEK